MVVKNLSVNAEQKTWVWKIPWRKAKQPSPLFLPGETHGQLSVAGYGAQGHKELDMTEATYTHTHTTLQQGQNIIVSICILGKTCKNRYGDGSMHFKYLFVEQFAFEPQEEF